jgi:hypothetical protein
MNDLKMIKKSRPQLNQLQEFSYEKTAILAGIMTTGEAIALKPVVENLGLDWSSQLKKIKRDHKLNQLWSSHKVVSSDGNSYEMVCASPANFQEWLWSLNVSENVNVELLETYKKGLVVYLLSMLKMSLDKIQEIQDENHILKQIKELSAEIEELKSFMDNHIDLSKRFRKEIKSKEAELKSLINQNPNQLKISI